MIRSLFGRREPTPSSASRPAPIFGVMRFSTLIDGKSGFRQMHELDLEARARLLFNADRMETRFRFFEALALPSLIAQDRDDWQFLLFYSDSLPDTYLTRLKDLIAPYKRIHAVNMRPHERLARTIHDEMGRLSDDDAPNWISFRFDDDDALASNYISRLRETADQFANGLFAITYPSGYVLGVDTKRQCLHLNPDVKLFGIGCGLAIHAPRELRRGVYNLGAVHRHVDNRIPTISDAREPLYVVGAHLHSDTGDNSPRIKKVMQMQAQTPGQVAVDLGDKFAHLDLERLLA